MQPNNAPAGTLFTLKSAKSRPKEGEIFSAPTVKVLPAHGGRIQASSGKTKDPSGKQLDCRAGGSSGDLMRPEIILRSR